MRIFNTTIMYGLTRLMNSPALQFKTPFLLELDSIQKNSIKRKGIIAWDHTGSTISFVVQSQNEKGENKHVSNEKPEIRIYGPLLLQDAPRIFGKTILEEVHEFLTRKPFANEENFALQFPLSLARNEVLKEFLNEDPSFLIITDPLNKARSRGEFLNLVHALMEHRSGDIPFVYGGFIQPWDIPMYYYLGFDGFISSWPLFATSQRKTLRYGKHVITVADSNITYDALLTMNKKIMRDEINHIVFELVNGNMRDYVEEATHRDANNATMLRIIDRHHIMDRVWKGIPVSHKSQVNCIGEESLHRPEVKMYQNRVLKNYVPPTRSLVVILPCSARKPYFTSRSHQRFNHVIQKVARKSGVNITSLVVTSPLGGVPSELDLIFPVANYDIPVTGDWSEEELQVTSKFVGRLLNKYVDEENYFVAYSSEDYEELILRSFKQSNAELQEQMIVSKTTDPTNLAKFESMLWKSVNDLRESLNPPPLKIRRYGEALKFKSMVDYQFGSGSGEALFHDFSSITIKGKYPRNLIAQKAKQNLAVLNWDTGKITLSLEGALKIKDVTLAKIVFSGETLEGSSIFPIGIKSISSDLHPLDEVLIVNEQDELIATGYILVDSETLEHSKRGAMVKIRKKTRQTHNEVNS